MSAYTDASLIMVPSGYKDGTLYSAKPTNGDGDFTFSRGSNLAATRVNSDGLIEKGRENLLLQSNQFDTTWTRYNATLTSSQSGYDGTNDAWSLNLTGSGGFLNITLSNSGVQTKSIYAKAGTLNFCRVLAATIPDRFAYFDLVNGSVETNTNLITANIESVGNGWYRLSITFSASTSFFRIYPAQADNDLTATSGSIYIQSAQLEQGLVATPYIETGASTAQAGILEDMPRLDYSGGASCPSLLLEPQRVNHLTQSEYYSGGTWIKQSGTTVTQNTTDTLSPEGKYNASKVTSNGSNGLFHTSVYTAGGANTKSIYLKGVSGGEVVYLKDPYQTVSTTTCTLTTEWQRFTLSETQTSSASLWIDDIPSGGIYMWGAMLESSASYVSSYIPTYGSGVTRTQEYGRTLVNSYEANEEQGVMFAEFEYLGGKDFQVVSMHNGGSIVDWLMINSAGHLTGAVFYDGAYQVSMDSSPTTLSPNTYYKAAFRYESGNNALYLNGVKVGTDTSTFTNPPTLGYVQLGGFWQLSNTKVNCRVKQALLFNTALTDAECIDLTTI